MLNPRFTSLNFTTSGRLLAALALASALPTLARAQIPLVQYLFNEGSGTVAANSGSAGSSANLTLNIASTDVSWSSTSFNAYAGSAISFDGVPNNAAPSFLSNGTNWATANGAAVNGLTSFTITMWVNLQATDGIADRLISMQDGSNGFDLRFNGFSGGLVKLSLWVDGSNTNVADTVSDMVGKWAFVAVTYNGSLASGATGNVAFYGGNLSTSVARSGGLATLDKGAVNSVASTTNALRLASQAPALTSLDRSPNALFDDVRIYDSVLDLTQLEAARLNGISAIPEPATYAAVAAACALAGAVIRRRRRA